MANTSSARSSESSSPPKKRSKLFGFMDRSQQNTESQQVSDTLLLQVEEYLQSPTLPEDGDLLSYWKDNCHRYPELSKIACRYLQIPASSGPVERLFSIAGKVFRPDRCRLTDEMFAKLMFIRCNELCEVNVDVV